MRVKEDVADFLCRFIRSEMSRKWFTVTREGKKERQFEWERRQASVIVDRHFDLVASAQFDGKDGRLGKWWHDLRLKVASLDCLGDKEIAERLVWIRDDTFVDPVFADRRRAHIKMNTVCDVEVSKSGHRLSRFFTAWFRLQRQAGLFAITGDMLIDEINQVSRLRKEYAQRREADEKRGIQKNARQAPEEILLRLSNPEDQERPKVWESILVNATRPRSRFFKAVMRSNPRQSVARNTALMKRGDEAHKWARELDYFIRITPASLHRYEDLLTDLLGIVRDQGLPNRKLAKILKALRPQADEKMQSYASFLHDLRAILTSTPGLPAPLYVGDVLNALNARKLSEVSRCLRVISNATPEVREAALLTKPKSLKQAEVAIRLREQADLFEAIEARLHEWPAQYRDRLAHNAFRLGAGEQLSSLLAMQPSGVAEQTTPEFLSFPVKGSSVVVEYSNLKTPDGWMAMALPQICIPFGSACHREQFGCDAGYLAIYDDEEIILGGFLVSAGDYILLNNLQGGLKGSANKEGVRKGIAAAVGEVLSLLGKPVAMRDLAFNAFSLVREMELPERDLVLQLPDIRLDNPSTGSFFCFEKGSTEDRSEAYSQEQGD